MRELIDTIIEHLKGQGYFVLTPEEKREFQEKFFDALPSQKVAEKVLVKKKSKGQWSAEARAKMEERKRLRREEKEGKVQRDLSGAERMVLFHMNAGAHWPSEIGNKINFTTYRTQEMLKRLAKMGFVCTPRADQPVYFDITDQGREALKENSIQKTE